jgi:hypothetical protein
MRAGGIFPAIIGTIYLTLGTAVFSVPLGVAAGVYIAEYATDNWVTRLIRITIINLAGIPSVVFGLFGLGLFVIFLRFGTSILAASMTLSIMTLPVIISTTEEALRSVPNSFRVVSLSMRHPLADDLAHHFSRFPVLSPGSSSVWSARQAKPHQYCLPERHFSCRAYPIRHWMLLWRFLTISL